MLVRFYLYGPTSSGSMKEREDNVYRAVAGGAAACGERVEAMPASTFAGADPAVDIVCMVGLRAHTREVLDAYRAIGKRVLIFDKGLIRFHNQSEYFRVYLDDGTPNRYLMRRKRKSARWERLGFKLKDKRAPSGPSGPSAAILYANNSQKVHDFWKLGDSQALAEQTVAAIRGVQRERPIVYRPKPRAMDFRPIAGAKLSLKPETIEGALQSTHCLITYTSSTAINAIMLGVPVIALGPTPAKPVAGKYLEQIFDPPFPDDEQRFVWLCNLAWCQWTDAEMRSGEMWEFLRGEIAATAGGQA